MVCLAAGPPRVRQGGWRGNREPGESPGLPRSGEWERPRQTALGPLAFMELQNVQELSNFFERRVSAYQVGVTRAVTFDDEF